MATASSGACSTMQFTLNCSAEQVVTWAQNFAQQYCSDASGCSNCFLTGDGSSGSFSVDCSNLPAVIGNYSIDNNTLTVDISDSSSSISCSTIQTIILDLLNTACASAK